MDENGILYLKYFPSFFEISVLWHLKKFFEIEKCILQQTSTVKR